MGALVENFTPTVSVKFADSNASFLKAVHENLEKNNSLDKSASSGEVNDSFVNIMVGS